MYVLFSIPGYAAYMAETSKFFEFRDTSDGQSPGMQEALSTFTQYGPVPIEPTPPPEPTKLQGFVQKLQDMLRGEWYNLKDQYYLTKEAVRVTAKDPAVLATALPFVEKLQMERTLDTLSKVPEGADLVAKAKETRTRIASNFGRLGAGYSKGFFVTPDIYDDTRPSVQIQGFSDKSMRAGLMIHELQHLNQDKAGVLEIQLDISPVERVWYDRVTEADAHATAVDIAFKLKMIGEEGGWDYLRSKHDTLSGGSIAAAYEAAAEKDPDSIYDGRAKREAYDAWFEAEMPSGVKEDLSVNYNSQGVRKAGIGVDNMLNSGRDKNFAPLLRQDIEKLGDLSPVNYMKLPGYRPIDDPSYRKANWSAYQAGYLSAQQQKYQTEMDRIKAKDDPAEAPVKPAAKAGLPKP
jgi:hypothetical protein